MNKIELEIDDQTARRLHRAAAQMRLDPVDAARAAFERGLAAIDRETILAELDDIFRDAGGANQSSDDDLLMREAIRETQAARDRRRRGG